MYQDKDLSITIVVDEKGLERAKNLNLKMGMVAWNIATILAPVDTGNLRRSIMLTTNTQKKVSLHYDLMSANYIRFLEEGYGPVKKHIGFIGDTTRLAITEAYVAYIETGHIPMYTSIPTINLNDTSNIFGTEKQILRSANNNASKISANSRREISRERESMFRSKFRRNLWTTPNGLRARENYVSTSGFDSGASVMSDALKIKNGG